MEWVSTKERLPAFNEPVIWWHKEGHWIGDREDVHHFVGYLDMYESRLFVRYYCHDDYPEYDVEFFSHWTSFPDAPKEVI